ncbi:hypothetical protein [Arthrobacter sp. NEB 688]|uniref:hypothetical protein n=1 Tax=Arthrobacter sp. NEB 688 TaxID=904039 RepID=UPI0015631814|nr:hypothetical protein [Arthrobacter sp. NEB 688]QKE84485.1 hypothetical protein HL663_11410 [Arthrobacter sp. NEB 688]
MTPPGAVGFDYFAAADDLAAAALGLSWDPARRRRPPRPVFGTTIDPVVRCAQLEELLTGRPHREVVADPRSARALDPAGDPAVLVVTVTCGLQAALAVATAPDLQHAAAVWARTTGSDADSATTRRDRTSLHGLARLARASLADELLLYCRPRPR